MVFFVVFEGTGGFRELMGVLGGFGRFWANCFTKKNQLWWGHII